MEKRKVYIIGAGVTGLTVAYKLSKSGKYNVVVFEKNSGIGGMAATFKKDGDLLDLGPHKFFSNMKDREREVLDIIGKNNLLKIKKKSQIRIFGKFIDFPIGPIDVFKVNPLTGIQMGVSYGWTILRGLFFRRNDKSYEDYLESRFGKVTYGLTLAPYARKIWDEPKKLDADLAATRVAAPNLLEMIKQMVFKVKSKKTISADYFHYPKKGSMFFLKQMYDEVIKNGGKFFFDSELQKVVMKNDGVKSMRIGGKDVDFSSDDVLISTVPTEDFVRHAIGLKKVRKDVDKLRYKNLLLVYIVLKKNRVSDQNWYFFPESKYIFNRVFEQKGFSKTMVSSNRTVLCCEVTCGEGDKRWVDEKYRKEMVDVVIDQLVECGIIDRADVVESFVKRVDRGYPIYFIGYRKVLDRIFGYLDKIKNFYSIGRQGGYNYVGMVDCFDIGSKVADFLHGKGNLKTREELRESFYKYIVID